MKYVAFLRGIYPSNPKMSNANIRRMFESLGFKNVQTVIASGNVIFESTTKNQSALEKKIETAFPQELGFSSTTIIRTESQLRTMVAADPFQGKEHSQHLYLIVTFRKSGGEICTVIDRKKDDATKAMARIEKKHGKDVTTRTWKTIGRIMTILDAAYV